MKLHPGSKSIPKCPIKLYDVQLWRWDEKEKREFFYGTVRYNVPYPLAKYLKKIAVAGSTLTCTMYSKLSETEYSKQRRKEWEDKHFSYIGMSIVDQYMGSDKQIYTKVKGKFTII